MATKQENSERSELHKLAVDNYIGCLALPKQSQVLIITENMPPGDEVIPFDLGLRRTMAKSLDRQLQSNGHRTVMLDISPFMDENRMLYPATYTALLELEGIKKNGGDRSTTIACLTDNLLDASGIYAAASSFSQYSTMRYANSMGFGIGDYLLMSNLDESKRGALKEYSEKMKKDFGEHTAGEIEIKTPDAKKHDLTLSLKFNTDKAPFQTDLGMLGTDSTVKIPGKDFQYAKVPGGEMYAAPYPFNAVNGRFSSYGYIFDIHHGFLVHISTDQEASAEYLNEAQKNLISIVQHGKSIPVSQFGFGFQEAAGIKTHTNSSVARKRRGLYIGFGQAESSTPESGIIHNTAGTLHHVDFVLDNPMAELRSGNSSTMLYSAKS